MGDVAVAIKSTEMEEQRPGSRGLDKTAEEGGQERTEENRGESAQTRVGGDRDSNGLPSSVSGAKSMGRSMVMLETIPGELHLEILRLLDVPSLFAMRSLNRYFRRLTDENEDTIVRGCLKNAECIGPHASLLRFYPLTDPENTTFSHAKRIHEMKLDTIRIARMVRQTQNAKIDALYCIRQTCERFQNLHLPEDGVEIPQSEIVAIQNHLLGEYTTRQIQNMLPLYIRLVYKVAEFLQFQFRGHSLSYEHYFYGNVYLLARGPELLLQLEELSPIENVEEVLKELFVTIRPYHGYFGIVHEELINELQRRGSGMMTEPGIEIEQFFREENTTLDLRKSSDMDRFMR